MRRVTYATGNDAGALHPGAPGAQAAPPGISLRAPASVHEPGWLALRQALWPDGAAAEHLDEMACWLADPARYLVLLAHAGGGAAVASDALLDNETGQAVHRALGFEETERTVFFRIVLDGR